MLFDEGKCSKKLTVANGEMLAVRVDVAAARQRAKLVVILAAVASVLQWFEKCQ